MKKAPTWKVYLRTFTEESYYGPRVVGSMADWQGEASTWGDDIKPGWAAFPSTHTFAATLRLDGFFRGRSAAGFRLTDVCGASFVIRMSEMVKLLKATTVYKGDITGTWGFVKQGANYSLTWLGEG